MQDAERADQWIELGSLAETAAPQKRPAAVYLAYETTVRLYDRDFRAIVVHSSAHDKRRHKRIDRLLAKKRKELDALCKKIRSSTYFCLADAQVAADKLQAASVGSYHKKEEKIIKIGQKLVWKIRSGVPIHNDLSVIPAS